MNRLQLYITSSHNGYKSLMQINAVSDIKQYIHDLTEAMENITFLQSEKHTFYLLKYIEDGTFITVMRTIPNCGSDHLAAWLFVPAEIDIRPNDLTGMVSVIAGVLSNPAITEDEAGRLQHLLQRAYPSADRQGCMVQNYGVQYAHRYYGSDTGMRLTDLIGDMRYQTSYLPYAGVILADKDDVTDIEGADLTGRSLKRMVRMLPPEPTEGPYQPTIFNMPFEAPYLVPLGSVVEVLWTALGRDAVLQTVDVLRADMKPAIPSEIPQQPASADPSETTDTDIPVAEPVLINEDPCPEQEDEEKREEEAPETEPAESIDDEQPVDEPADTDERADTDESADHPTGTAGYSAPSNDDAGSTDTQQGKTALRPSAEPTGSMQKRVYIFETPSSSTAIGHMVHFEIQSRSPLTDSPLEGYELTADIQEGPSRINRLEYVGPTGIRRRHLMWGLAGMAGGIVLTLLASLACSRNRSTPTPPVVAQTTGTPADSTPASAAPIMPAGKTGDKVGNKKEDTPASTIVPTPSPTASSVADDVSAAVKYLDTHTTWTKAELDNIPALKGLYDDLNQYRLRVIIDKWGPLLKDSKSFAKLVGHCQGALRAGKIEKNNVTPPYTNTGQIAVYPWECRVDK